MSNKEADDRIARYNGLMAEFFTNYAMLVINSFGLQNAMERSPVDIPHFFARVHSSAKTCAVLVKDELGPLEFLKYAPDSHFVFASYAVLSLLKVSPGVLLYLDRRCSCFSLRIRCFDPSSPHHEIMNTRHFSWSKTLPILLTRSPREPHIHLRCTAHSYERCWRRRLSRPAKQPATVAT